MKVLWYTNTACSASDKLNLNLGSGTGGWLRSLEEEINHQTNIELSICFYSQAEIDPFKHGKIQFYPIYRPDQRSKLSRLKNRWYPQNHENAELSNLLTVARKSMPDIIHIHGTENNFGLIQRKVNIPVVLSIQGILNSVCEKYFTGIPYHVIKKHESFAIKVIGGGINRSFKRFANNAKREKKMLYDADHIIGRTEYDRRISRILAPFSQYYIINEVFRPLFYEHEWNKKKMGPVIQIVSILSGGIYKGFETLAGAAKILIENTDVKFVWNVIGFNRNNNVVKLLKRWRGFDVENLNIRLHGLLSENEIVKILLNSDIYCQTSHIENSPNALGEALILGLPCIATFAGGTGSIMEDGKEGILIQDGDPWSMAGAIQEMAKNDEKAIQFGKNAYKMARKRHDKKTIVTELVNVYEKIIGNTN